VTRALLNAVALLVAAAAFGLALARARRGMAPGATRSALGVAIVAVNCACALGVGAEVFALTVLDAPVVISHDWYVAYRPGRYTLRPNLRSVGSTRNPRWKQFAIETNADGLRSSPVPDGPPRPGERRVLFLGDSYVFGIGLDADETVPAQATRLLQSRAPGARWVGYNAGVPGYNASSAVDLLEWLADRYRPSVVALTVQFDDIAPDFNDELRRLGRDLDERRRSGLARFALYRLVRATFSLARYRSQFELRVTGDPAVRPELLPEQLARVEAAASKLAALKARLGFDFVLQVLFKLPSENPEDAEAALHYLHFDGFRRAGARVVFTRWDHEAPGADAIPLDGHPTPAGARRIAEGLAGAILDGAAGVAR